MYFALCRYYSRWRGGGVPRGWVQNLPMQLFILGNSKIEVFETYFYDMLIT